MTLDESTFESLADTTLAHLFDTIDEVLGDQIDVDLEGGILTLELDSGGQYVINKHAPNRQIWVSSPKSGASHYDHRDGRWIGTRDGADLQTLLAAELAALTGTRVDLG
ncbi:MAG: iron donor protein CyaY [Hyphomicrobiales bacterium]|nr:iron donor protein CyaY [Hyphomicrobiales bacterium]